MTTTVTPASATLDTTRSPACLRIAGDWTLANYTPLKRSTEALHGQYDASAQVDLAQLGKLDTAGASLLVELLGAERLGNWPMTTPARCRPPTAPCCTPCTARYRTTACQSASRKRPC